jgi:hypothetical protein
MSLSKESERSFLILKPLELINDLSKILNWIIL